MLIVRKVETQSSHHKATVTSMPCSLTLSHTFHSKSYSNPLTVFYISLEMLTGSKNHFALLVDEFLTQTRITDANEIPVELRISFWSTAFHLHSSQPLFVFGHIRVHIGNGHVSWSRVVYRILHWAGGDKPRDTVRTTHSFCSRRSILCKISCSFPRVQSTLVLRFSWPGELLETSS